jgi:peroxiredoxin
MHRATNDLQNSPQMLKTITVGDKAPEFSLKNTANTDVPLRDLLSRGPVVLNFYRGRW